jgi:ribonucleotide monophosphatase NagD (HAD superfamily)
MVGDDVLGDVVGATDAGLQGCLVRTGKYQAGDEKHLNEDSLVIDSIADLIED